MLPVEDELELELEAGVVLGAGVEEGGKAEQVHKSALKPYQLIYVVPARLYQELEELIRPHAADMR